MPELLTAALYKFVDLPDYAAIKGPLLACCEQQGVKGTILLAQEGINGTIAGQSEGIHAVLRHLRCDPRLSDLVHKETYAAKAPFRRLKVRLKREIVSMSVPGINPAKMAGQYVAPQDWNKLLDDPEVVLVDVRNEYEVAVGTFRGALNPHIDNFSELPGWIGREKSLQGKPKVAMFCTGGIRCEKSTALLRSQGFAAVYHLQGGILKYLETVPESESRWQGECFVFDERVSLMHGLKPGTLALCRSCRQPVSEHDKTSPLYVAGVSCHRCHDATTEAQKRSRRERQKQMELADRRNQEKSRTISQSCIPHPRSDARRLRS